MELISKKDNVQSFSNLRPISLSKFVNKIQSKIVHFRLVSILPRLISPNRLGFVKESNIIENVLLTQELIVNIGQRRHPSNVVMKLDMANTYDRVSYFFLIKVMRKMDSSNMVINVIWIFISNNYYSILLNDQSVRFFHSTRGLSKEIFSLHLFLY